jgi:hypothetical protein
MYTHENRLLGNGSCTSMTAHNEVLLTSLQCLVQATSVDRTVLGTQGSVSLKQLKVACPRAHFSPRGLAERGEKEISMSSGAQYNLQYKAVRLSASILRRPDSPCCIQARLRIQNFKMSRNWNSQQKPHYVSRARRNSMYNSMHNCTSRQFALTHK